MAELIARNLSVTAGDTPILTDASFSLKPGELVAVLGPNGAGKTTLVRAALGIEPPDTGDTTLDCQPMDRLSPMERARIISYLPQQRPLAWPAAVRDVVALGRFAHGAAMGRLSAPDATAVETALNACGLQALADRATDTLSGGELARVHLARAFAADAPLMIADEPVAALDPRHQYQTMALIRRFVDEGKGALVILHDIALAARFADRLIWMRDGHIAASGSVADTLTEDRLTEIYGVRARIIEGQSGPIIEIMDGAW